MTEKSELVSLLDFHYSIHTELENLTDEEMVVWQEEQQQIAENYRGSIELVTERYNQTGSKLYKDSLKSLQDTGAVHQAMARLPNPYKLLKK